MAARGAWNAVSRARADESGPHGRVIALRSRQPIGAQALVCFRLEPFLQVQQGRAPDVGHPTFWLSYQTAMSLLDLGYDVDVISQHNQTFWPRKDYRIVLDVRFVLQRISRALGPRCAKLVYLDTAHLLFQSAAEAGRLLSLQRRRGISLPAERFLTPTLALEHADLGLTAGNEFTVGTYRHAGKPIRRMPIPAAFTAPWPDHRAFAACQRRVLFLASRGLVHKGLDLVLEAFASMPDVQLVVCAPIEAEPAFARAYHRELFETPNVTTPGWVDIRTDRFLEIAHGCAAVILPSCSEGGAASPVEGMHAGLIPIVSRETGVDVGDFGITLKGEAVDDVRAAVTAIAELPAPEAEQRARAAWEHARAHHTRPLFVEAFLRTVREVAG